MGAFRRLNMTDERTNDEFIAEVIRRGKQTSSEWKVEELVKLYLIEGTAIETTRNASRVFDEIAKLEQATTGDLSVKLQEILGSGWTREEPRGCTNKLCSGTERRPCRLLQYIESCTKCGTRMGDVPTQTWGN